MDALVNNFLTDVITLDQKDISSSAVSRDWFLEKLIAKIAEYSNVPILYAEKPTLNFGSYFKGTKVSNVDEYDILVILDSNGGQYQIDNTTIGKGLGVASPNPKYDFEYKKTDTSFVSPIKLMNWFERVVGEVVKGFGGEEPVRDGSAITVTIKSKGFAIDLVPAGIFQNINDENDIFYTIYSGRKSFDWIITRPDADITIITELEKKFPGAKNIIRLLKYIKQKENYNFLVSSYAIESCVVDYTKQYAWKDSVYENLKNNLKHLGNSFKNSKIPDMVVNSNNILYEFENSEFYSSRVYELVESLDKIKTNELDKDRDIAYEKFINLLNNK